MPPGTLLTTVSFWSRQGAGPPAVTRDGTPATGPVTTLGGRSVLQVPSRLAPGEGEELAVRLPLHDGGLSLWTTPTLTSPGVASFRCDGDGSRAGHPSG